MGNKSFIICKGSCNETQGELEKAPEEPLYKPTAALATEVPGMAPFSKEALLALPTAVNFTALKSLWI